MGFIIWYKLEFAEGGTGGLGPLRVSNDVLSGDYALDADIKLVMDAGASADAFEITLTNLPGDVAEFVNVYVDGEDIRFQDGLETSVEEGDEVTILPAVAGGE